MDETGKVAAVSRQSLTEDKIMCQHALGSRVRFPKTVKGNHVDWREGTVTSIYGYNPAWPWIKSSYTQGMDMEIWQYPELYVVTEDNGVVSQGYFPTALQRVS